MKKPILLALLVLSIGLLSGATMPTTTTTSTVASERQNHPPDIIVPGKYISHTSTTLTCGEGQICAVIKVRIDKPYGSVLVVEGQEKDTFQGQPVYNEGTLVGFETNGQVMQFKSSETTL